MLERRLADLPDWGYLLREYYELYRFLSSGGSDRIRTHQRAVREAISRVLKSNPPIEFNSPAEKPVNAHLKRALDEGKLERTAPFIRSIESIQQHLIWQYGYEKVPRGLEKTYAYAEICGPNGPILTDQVILGFVLFAPGCTYPSHAHDGISESYICLSGAVSETIRASTRPDRDLQSAGTHPPDHGFQSRAPRFSPMPGSGLRSASRSRRWSSAEREAAKPKRLLRSHPAAFSACGYRARSAPACRLR